MLCACHQFSDSFIYASTDSSIAANCCRKFIETCPNAVISLYGKLSFGYGRDSDRNKREEREQQAEENLPPPSPPPPIPKAIPAALTGRTGGIYIPGSHPHRMAQMMRDVDDKLSEPYRRLSCALRKSINGLVNKVNAPKGITESLREYLMNMPHLIMQQKPASELEDESGSSSDDSSGSNSSSGSESESENESEQKSKNSSDQTLYFVAI